MAENRVNWEIITVADRWEAEIIRGVLKSAGLHVRLKGESVAHLYGLSVGPLGEVEVMVPSEEAYRARAILARAGRDVRSEHKDKG